MKHSVVIRTVGAIMLAGVMVWTYRANGPTWLVGFAWVVTDWLTSGESIFLTIARLMLHAEAVREGVNEASVTGWRFFRKTYVKRHRKVKRAVQKPLDHNIQETVKMPEMVQEGMAAQEV